MTAQTSQQAMAVFASAIAEDATGLAVLHDRELDMATIAALKAAEFPHNLGLTAANRAVWQFMREAVVALPDVLHNTLATDNASAESAASPLDDLAAAYAEVYLTGGLGASPCESAWLDDDHLLYQGPMFELRAIYQRDGLAASNWRVRPEDHIAMQLGYISHLATMLAMKSKALLDDESAAQIVSSWQGLATLLDEHVLLWLPEFAQRLAMRRAHPFYAALAATTVEWLEVLRDTLAMQFQLPRPRREDVLKRRQIAQHKKPAQAQPIAFVPGGNAPSW